MSIAAGEPSLGFALLAGWRKRRKTGSSADDSAQTAICLLSGRAAEHMLNPSQVARLAGDDLKMVKKTSSVTAKSGAGP